MKSKEETPTPSVHAELIVLTPAAFLQRRRQGARDARCTCADRGRRTGARSKAL